MIDGSSRWSRSYTVWVRLSPTHRKSEKRVGRSIPRAYAAPRAGRDEGSPEAPLAQNLLVWTEPSLLLPGGTTSRPGFGGGLVGFHQVVQQSRLAASHLQGPITTVIHQLDHLLSLVPPGYD